MYTGLFFQAEKKWRDVYGEVELGGGGVLFLGSRKYVQLGVHTAGQGIRLAQQRQLKRHD